MNFIEDYCGILMSLEAERPDLYSLFAKKLELFKNDDDEELILRHYQVIRKLYLPYTQEGIFPINDMNPFNLFKDFIKGVDFKGRKNPKQEFLLLDRSTFGLYTKLKGLKSEINWISGRNKFRNSIENQVKIKYQF
jgi:hypothetical protein